MEEVKKSMKKSCTKSCWNFMQKCTFLDMRKVIRKILRPPPSFQHNNKREREIAATVAGVASPTLKEVFFSSNFVPPPSLFHAAGYRAVLPGLDSMKMANSVTKNVRSQMSSSRFYCTVQ